MQEQALSFLGALHLAVVHGSIFSTTNFDFSKSVLNIERAKRNLGWKPATSF